MAERLTEYDSHGYLYVKNHDYISASYKLARYEDLEEQGYRMVNINKIIEQLEENYSCDVGNLKMISVDKVIEVVKGSME